MNRPELYSTSNELQRTTNLNCLGEYTQKINWQKDGDTAIDVGCGDGSFSVYLKNYKPHKDFYYKKFIAADINENMIQFANRRYMNEGVLFRRLDITGDVPEDLIGSFNHLFSFFMLHHVKEQEKAFNNIYKLLVKGGDILINFVKESLIYDVYQMLYQKAKWKRWMKNLDNIVSPYYNVKNTKYVLVELLEKIGFKNIVVETKMTTFYHDEEEMRDFVLSVNVFNMPNDVADEFAQDFLLCAKENGLTEMTISDNKTEKLMYKHYIQYNKSL